MKLGKKQEIFGRNLGMLLHWMTTARLHFRIKEIQRPRALAELYAEKGIGIINSLHCDSLAVDIDMVTNKGKYIETCTEDEELDTANPYVLAGLFWEHLGGIWGGRFKRKDCRHFEWNENMR